MVRYSFLLIIFIGFFTISAAVADVCDSKWWETATVPDLNALSENGDAFPEICNVWNDTPLHLGVQNCQSAEVIAAFIDITRANVLAINTNGQTPLGLARDRLNTAEMVADTAGDIAFAARQEASSARQGQSRRHLRRQLDAAAIKTREARDQAEEKESLAEAIHQLLSASQ